MRVFASTFALVALCSTLAIGRSAQNPPAAPPLPPVPAAAAAGGGRGRGGMQVMTLTSTAWPDGGQIPVKYSQADDDVSPPLSWSDAPDSTASFVLIVHDLDAAIGNGTRRRAALDGLEHSGDGDAACRRRAAGSQLPDGTRQISVTGPYYRGPARRRRGRRITTCSSCSRSTRCSTSRRSAPRPPRRAPRSSPRWRDTFAARRSRRAVQAPVTPSHRRRVVVTGVGLVSPLGVGTDVTWRGLLSGASGIGPITLFDAARYSTRFAGEVPAFDPLQWIDKKDVKKCGRFIQFAIAATTMAMEQSGLRIEPANAERVGVMIGSGIGGFEVIEREHRCCSSAVPSASRRSSFSRRSSTSRPGRCRCGSAPRDRIRRWRPPARRALTRSATPFGWCETATRTR